VPTWKPPRRGRASTCHKLATPQRNRSKPWRKTAKKDENEEDDVEEEDEDEEEENESAEDEEEEDEYEEEESKEPVKNTR